jgi:pimeloyl-ACP methyl ester carboxylesterase
MPHTAAKPESVAAPAVAAREKVQFPSGDDRCVAWHYAGTNGACVVMAGGLAVAKEPGTDLFAARFHKAGFSVLAFDFRGLGESGGSARQVVRMRDQQADYRAAIRFAQELPEVDPAKVAGWGFSASGGHLFVLAARVPELCAAIAVSPLADGLAAMPNALRHMTPLAALRLNTRALLDAVGGRLGRDPLLIPLAGRRGEVASLTTPDSLTYAEALNPGDRYPAWQQAVAARSAMRLGFYRPGRFAAHARCPLLVVVPEADGVAPSGPAVRAAQRAPRGEVFRVPGGHYAPLLSGHEAAVEAQLEFLGRTVLNADPR